VITLDGCAASHRAVDRLKTSGILPRRVQVRSCKYLNNMIEQDHRRIKQRVRPMLGFKRFEKVAIISFHQEFPLEGYRRLTFMMLDRDVVAPALIGRSKALGFCSHPPHLSGQASKVGNTSGCCIYIQLITEVGVSETSCEGAQKSPLHYSKRGKSCLSP
jgi:hypothetical protein